MNLLDIDFVDTVDYQDNNINMLWVNSVTGTSKMAAQTNAYDNGLSCAITITNSGIVDFYRENPHINIEQVNLAFIQMFKQSKSSGDNSSDIEEQRKQIASIHLSISAISQNMQSLKHEYMQEINTIMANNALTTNEKITAVLDRNSTHLVDRTTILLTEGLPKQQEGVKTQYNAWFKEISDTLLEQTNRLTTSSLPEFISSFEQKYTGAIQSSMHQLEERLLRNIDTIKSDTIKTTVSQSQLSANIDEFLAKYNNSSNKGKVGEANLSAILTNLFPSAECINTTGVPNSGDFRLTRCGDKPVIIFENKDYAQNVDKSEIAKFIYDVDSQKSSGIFLSQSSGISLKNNYQIDFNHGHILVYVHHCGYCPEKIRAAVDIIDSLEPKLKILVRASSAKTTDIQLQKEILDEINREYQMFLVQKDNMLATIKEYTKKMTKQVDELCLPELDKLLGKTYAYVKTNFFSCELCSKFTGHTKQSLAAHMRCCRRTNIQPEKPGEKGV